ncbi:MAG: ComEC/Rec2 family competence protein [Rhodobacteraceae bacterium]|nr:ComEC/Rec2 family competence protein [Paracoccaceae bacterium]
MAQAGASASPLVPGPGGAFGPAGPALRSRRISPVAWLAAALAASLDRQRGALLPWAAVAFGGGIALWFLPATEPGPVLLLGCGLAALVLAGVALAAGPARAPPLWALALVAAGFAAAGERGHRLAAPVLERPLYTGVEGRILSVDRSQSDRLRVMLGDVRIPGMPPEATPRRIRIALHADREYVMPTPGLEVAITARLFPPSGPAEPGGYDFQRHAWFMGLGATGYARLPLMVLAEPAPRGAAARLARLRADLSAAIRARMSDRAGPFAAAILVGDRAWLDLALLADLRASNLAHLLAISGLHMGLVTGLAFFVLRGGLALWPRVALRLPVKRIAACAALTVAAGYLALSGASVATQRAFVMAAVVLLAVLAGRRALSTRSVAVAALVVLAIRPESVAEPGFQMSFAATLALVAAFGALRHRAEARPGVDDRQPREAGALRWLGALVMSSTVAGLATAPFAAAHFSHSAPYGLIANLLSVPVMGLVVMPGAMAAALLAPIGLEGVGLAAADGGIRWILAVAERVAAFDGAARPVAAAAPHALPLVAFGGLVLLLWQGPGRWVGAAMIAAALMSWTGPGRPVLLVSADGMLAGVLGPEGRALSRPRGQSFVAGVWLRGDGDDAPQEVAAARPGLVREGEVLSFALGSARGALVEGPRPAPALLAALCARHALVIARAAIPAGGGCIALDPAARAAGGSSAVVLRDGAPQLLSATEWQGHRLWSPR